ncbi:MAG: hypothetical protein OXB97_03035 [Rhodospirillales bacterium]|nr:hypothetical protein [Rhodospirillales bacterium]
MTGQAVHQSSSSVDPALEDRAVGGLGIYLVRQMMDGGVPWRRQDGRNIVTLTKNTASGNAS